MSHECSECNRPVTSCECPPPLKCKHGKMLLTNGKGCACIECERDQLADLQAQNEDIKRQLKEYARLYEDKTLVLTGENIKQLRTRCEGAESYIKTMAAEASSLQDRIDELAIENDKLKRPVDLYARGLAEGRKAAYEDAVEIVKEVYRTYKGFMATGKGMMQITEETIKSKLGGE